MRTIVDSSIYNVTRIDLNQFTTGLNHFNRRTKSLSRGEKILTEMFALLRLWTRFF